MTPFVHRVVLIVAWALVAAAPSAAHTFAPSVLELTVEDYGVAVRFKQPQVRVVGSQLRPILPSRCEAIDGPETRTEGTGVVSTWRVTCPALVGETIEVEGIAGSRADVLLRLQLADGRSIHRVLTADRPAFVVPEAANALDVATLYGRLGWEHILSGFDHLLFVLGLILLIDGRRRLVATVTAFTAGHSVTLALAALGVVHVPSGPTEAVIAFSIIVLAVELTRPRGAESRLRRSPWIMAALFGLLHGLGFAGALTEIGLPEHEIPAALVSFNAGIEVGQLAFVAVVLGAVGIAKWGGSRWPRSAWLSTRQAGISRLSATVCAYGIGTLATFWFFERLAGIV